MYLQLIAVHAWGCCGCQLHAGKENANEMAALTWTYSPQIGLQTAPTPGRPQTSWHNGRSPWERSRKKRKQIRMKGCGMSLGIDVSHGYCPISASSGRLGNTHWPLQRGASYWGAKNTVILGPSADIVALGEAREEFLGEEVSIIMDILY